MANVKISELPYISLSETQYSPDERLGRLTMVSNYLDDDTESTGVAKGSELADCVWEYLTFVPEEDTHSMLGYEVDSIVEPYLSENFASLLGIYMTDYMASVTEAGYYEPFQMLAEVEGDGYTYIGKVEPRDVIIRYLHYDYYISSEVLPEQHTAYDTYVCFADSSLSSIWGVKLDDFVSYIKSQ